MEKTAPVAGAKSEKAADFVRAQRAKRGHVTEEAEQEILISEGERVWDAFNKLSGQRTVDEGGRPNHIAIADIKAIADILRVDEYEAEDFMTLILDLDQVYVKTRTEQLAELAKQEAKRQKSRNKRRRTA